MDSDTRHPDIPGRLRVVDLRVGSERRQLHFGGGFACVLAGTDARGAAARWIATSIVGPPLPDPGSDILADDPVWRLQAPLLPLRAPAVLDRDLLRTLWRSDCARRLEVLQVSRDAIQLERSRIAGALARVRVQPPLSAAAAASRPRSGAADAELATFKAAARRFVRVQSLLGEIDGFPPEVPPAALALADDWEAHLATPVPEPAPVPDAASVGPPSVDQPAARSAPPVRAPAEHEPAEPVDEARRAELEQLHGNAVKAEARLFGRSVLPRKRAVAQYNEARLREQAALAGAGVDSYEEFLQMVDAGAHARTRESADSVPVPATLEAAAGTDAPQEPPVAPVADALAAHAARTQELLAQARVILGRDPGDDVAGELREHLADTAARTERVEELAEVLREEGITDAVDVVGRAREFIATPLSVHIPQPPTWAMRVASEVPLSEIEGLEHQLNAKDALLADVDGESAHIAATCDLDLLRLGPDDFERVVGAMFDAYRAGEVLEGHLPLVLDGVLDGLAADARDAAVPALASVDDLQVIVVTDEDIVARRVSEAGGTVVHWPVSESQRQRDYSG